MLLELLDAIAWSWFTKPDALPPSTPTLSQEQSQANRVTVTSSSLPTLEEGLVTLLSSESVMKQALKQSYARSAGQRVHEVATHQ